MLLATKDQGLSSADIGDLSSQSGVIVYMQDKYCNT